MAESSRTERLPPQNVEAEEAVLGALLIDPDAIIRVATFLNAEDFYNNVHQTIYCVLRESILNNEKIDKVLLANKIAICSTQIKWKSNNSIKNYLLKHKG